MLKYGKVFLSTLAPDNDDADFGEDVELYIEKDNNKNLENITDPAILPQPQFAVRVLRTTANDEERVR